MRRSEEKYRPSSEEEEEPDIEKHYWYPFPRIPRRSIAVLFILGLAVWLLYSGIRLNLANKTEKDFKQNLQTSRNKMTSCVISASRAPFTINATSKASGLVIFLHGLGDDGNGWCEGFKHIKQKHVQYVFPNAEAMPVTLNMGMVMPSWFDIASLDMKGKEDEKGIKKAAEAVRNLMKAEQDKAGVSADRVVLGGFSMGGALALYTALTHTEQIGGLILLSSWLPLREKFVPKPEDGFSLTRQRCQIFQGHGDSDPLVLTKFGSETFNIIDKARKADWKEDSKVSFQLYKGMGHSSSNEEMNDVGKFLQKILPPV